MLFDHHHGLPNQRLHRRGRRPGERGYVMVMFALLLVPLLLMAGLAVDVGHWYSRISDMRRAADAAALAGVVWLPDIDAARTAALDAAARNGFTASSTVSITVTKSSQSDRRLKVTIRDTAVGSFFYSSLGGSKQDFQRTSFAEYILAVPMGSPRNFFGTGTLLQSYTATGITPEVLYQSVNPYCTDKVNGDRYQSGYWGTCSGTANDEYRTSGYQMYIEAPVGRTAAIDVKLYDARYSEAAVKWPATTGDSCSQEPEYVYPGTWTGPTGTSTNVKIAAPAMYQTKSSATAAWSSTTTLSGTSTFTFRGDRLRYQYPNIIWTPSATTWTGPAGTSGNVTIDGPAEYQTRTSTTASWSATKTLTAADASVTSAGNLIRYRLGDWQANQNCVDPVIDDFRQAGDEDYTYTLYQADNTPLNDDDNPQICQQTFTKDTAFDGTQYLGSRRWNTLCSITTAMPSGRYILKVTNSGAARSPLQDGSNQWGLVAKYATTGDGLCDGRNDTMCPRVYGKDAISVRAAATTTVASFYLAEILPEHAGKKLKLELYDPGEGGKTIEIMKPTGTNGNSWTPATFSWTADTGTSGNNVNSLDVTNSVFNGKLVTITIDLAGYSPPSNNDWWQIRYTFAGAVTDRTTWSARIVGDPVHLVEEY
ncbi:MAG: pilus assembly protein TadG-related protein [Aquihabitans sp.]